MAASPVANSLVPNALVTVAATARLSGEAGRSLVTLRGHHLVVDAPLVLGGPNEEVNPMDLLVGALATCAVFISDYVAREEKFPLKDLRIAVAGELDPRGMCGYPVNPRLQTLRLQAHYSGVSAEQAEILVQGMRTRCPIFTTLAQSIEIEVSYVLNP
jgi:uncharacterized OsmC-like protein